MLDLVLYLSFFVIYLSPKYINQPEGLLYELKSIMIKNKNKGKCQTQGKCRTAFKFQQK